jgi:DNA invertase Pin-like site-specific DNA recombinase
MRKRIKHTTCPFCSGPIPKGFYENKSKLKGQRVKAALKKRQEKGDHVGRPLEHDYEKIRQMRSKGLSMLAIANEIKCSTYTVQRAVGFPAQRRHQDGK